MKTNFWAYRQGLMAKEESLQASNPPAPAVAQPSPAGAQDQLLKHLQQEKKEDQDFRMTTTRIQTLAEIEQLGAEVRVRNWSLASDAQV